MKNLIRVTSVLFLLTVVVSCCIHKPDYWPTDEWQTSTPEAQRIDSEKLLKAIEPLVTDPAANLHSLIIIRNGYIVAEYYAPPHNVETLHNQFSTTKSFTSTLVGIAVNRGLLSTDQKVLSFFPDQEFDNMNDWKRQMTVKHLLMMSSGLDWAEWFGYDGRGNFWQECFDSQDWSKSILDRKVITKPGFLFNYNSGNSHLLSAILSKIVNQSVGDYARENLFAPLGITDYIWTEDPQGVPVGGFGLQLRPRDMAKLGYLYLNQGIWDGQRLLSKKWVREATTNHYPKGDIKYGYHFWIGSYNYSASGSGNQKIFIFPRRNIIVVTTGAFNSNLADQGNQAWNNFWTGFRESVVFGRSLPENSEDYKLLHDTLENLSTEKPVITGAPASITALVGKTIHLDKNQFDVTSFTIRKLEDKEVKIEISAIDPKDGAEKSALYTAGIDHLYIDNGCRGYPLSEAFSLPTIKYYHPDPDSLPVFVRGTFPDDRSLSLDFIIPGSIFPSTITLEVAGEGPVVWWEGSVLWWNAIQSSKLKIRGRI